MPDPKQMSGIPRPATDLPDHAISVRLIRGSLSNNITNFPVELHIGSQVKTVRTDESGRAQFNDAPAGATVKAVAIVDGERLESQEFAVPASGAIRLLLVATDKSKAAAPASAAPVSGRVTLGNQSRIVMEPGDEAVQVFYLLDIVNAAQAPVNPPGAFTFDMPEGAAGTTVMEGSSPQASVSGSHVTVKGPFAPGRTPVQVACELPASGASLELSQTFPADLEQLAVIVKKVGQTRLMSPNISNQQDMAAQGDVHRRHGWLGACGTSDRSDARRSSTPHRGATLHRARIGDFDRGSGPLGRHASRRSLGARRRAKAAGRAP